MRVVYDELDVSRGAVFVFLNERAFQNHGACVRGRGRKRQTELERQRDSNAQAVFHAGCSFCFFSPGFWPAARIFIHWLSRSNQNGAPSEPATVPRPQPSRARGGHSPTGSSPNRSLSC